MPKKKPSKGKPKVDKDLEGFDIQINEFGEIKSNYDMEKLYRFLNEKMDDKKLRDRDPEDLGLSKAKKSKGKNKKSKKKKYG